MRRRLLLLTGATTALVLTALLVPLTLLTRTHAADRATAEATARAQWVAAATGPGLAAPVAGTAAGSATRAGNGSAPTAGNGSATTAGSRAATVTAAGIGSATGTAAGSGNGTAAGCGTGFVTTARTVTTAGTGTAARSATGTAARSATGTAAGTGTTAGTTTATGPGTTTVPTGQATGTTTATVPTGQATGTTTATEPTGQATGREDAEQILRGVNGPGLPRVSLLLADGTVIGAPARVTDAVRLARTGRAFTYEPPDGGRVVLVPVHGAADGTAVVQAALSRGQLYDGVLTSWFVLAGIGVGLVLLGLLLADRLGARLVGATRSLARTADRLAAGDLEARAEPAGPAELRLIAGQLNRLGARIDELLTAERENAADLAHRLRTPVAALRLDAETLRDTAEAERIASGVAALERGVDEVIRRARRPLREAAPSTDLAAVARERAGFWLPLAEDQGRAVDVDTPVNELPVAVPEDELAAALDALIGNVLDHTPQGTAFRVEARATATGAELSVADEGPGFPGAHTAERGSSGAGSTGLGLDIARRTAEEAGGRFEAESAPGARVTLTFPASA